MEGGFAILAGGNARPPEPNLRVQGTRRDYVREGYRESLRTLIAGQVIPEPPLPAEPGSVEGGILEGVALAVDARGGLPYLERAGDRGDVHFLHAQRSAG